MALDRAEFVAGVQKIMRRDYCIEAEGPIEGAPGESPEQWVAWYVAKYDLVHRDEWTLDKAAELFREIGFEPPSLNKSR